MSICANQDYVIVITPTSITSVNVECNGQSVDHDTVNLGDGKYEITVYAAGITPPGPLHIYEGSHDFVKEAVVAC